MAGFDCPDGFRTVHAVVRLATTADAAKRKAATDIADAIDHVFESFAAGVAASDPPPLLPRLPPRARRARRRVSQIRGKRRTGR